MNSGKPKLVYFENERPGSTCLELKQGWNNIQMTALSGNFTPRDLIPGSMDSRNLSFSLSDIDLITNASQKDSGYLEPCK